MANAINAVTNGPGQLLYGLAWNPDPAYTISGLGLVTFGLLWLKNDIWTNCPAPTVVTWTSCPCNNNCT